MSVVAILPSQAAVEAAWDRYASLVRQHLDDPTLAVSLQHCQDVARAWGAWRDAFLAMDRR